MIEKDCITKRRATFAVPGDIASLTGGYSFDRKLINGLRHSGWDITLLSLGGSFPDPTRDDLSDAARQLSTVCENQPIIIDGLALGAFDSTVMASISAPIVALIHHPLALETGLSDSDRSSLRDSERQNLQQVSQILVPSPHTANVLRTDYGVDETRITVAGPGTDHSKVSKPKVDPPLILSVGIQVPRKGHDVLIEALAHIKSLPWNAVIAGGAFSTEYASELARLVAKLDLNERVRIAGRVSDDELATLYAQSSIFALATRYEGYGLVFDEAMMHGLPIISCKVGAVSETVAPDAGVLVPPDDPLEFAGALAKVLNDDDCRARMVSASARAGAALPSWASTVEAVEKVLLRNTLTPVHET